jgi:hypothetical protein
LKLARILIDSAIGKSSGENLSEQTADEKVGGSTTLLSLAGRYDGGPGNTSEVDETILETEVDTFSGLSVR